MSFPSRNARQRGVYLGPVDGDPDEADLDGGEMWFDTTTDTFRGYDGTGFVTFDTTADA